MKRHIWIVLIALIMLPAGLAACGRSEVQSPAADALYKVAFLYTGPPGDLGWTYEHDRGRRWAEAALGERIETTFVEENVEVEAEAGRILRQFAQEGYAMVFATAADYADVMFEVSQEFPGVTFENCGGSRTNDNLAVYFGRMYQPRYLAGIVAGRMTTSGNIGYVASAPNPEVIRGINAFALGVRSVNPGAEVHVRWTNDPDDPEKSREAAVALLDAGADIIAQQVNTAEPQKAAQERGMLSIGCDSDMRTAVGDSVLTSVVWHWGNYYARTIEDGLDGTWTTHTYWGGLADGVVGLADFSPKVPQDVRDLVIVARKRILDVEDVFCGPIRHQSGAVAIPAGTCMRDDDLREMRFFVEGVVGTLPED